MGTAARCGHDRVTYGETLAVALDAIDGPVVPPGGRVPEAFRVGDREPTAGVGLPNGTAATASPISRPPKKRQQNRCGIVDPRHGNERTCVDGDDRSRRPRTFWMLCASRR
jgi:hypothetical protein